MATDVERLVVRLEGRISHFEKAMVRARVSADKNLRQVERRADRMQRRLNKSFSAIGAVGGVLGRAGLVGGGVFGLGILGRATVGAADTVTEATNQIRSAFEAGGITRNVEEVRDSLADLAARTRSEFGATVQLFARLTRATAQMKPPVEDVQRAVEILNKAFQASGATASEAANGVRQLSQGLASGALQGDELRSIRENAPVIAQAIADAFGVTIGGLKALGAEGQLTAEKVFPAILAAGASIDAQFAVTERTVGKAFSVLGDRAGQFVSVLLEASGIAEGLTERVTAIADAFDRATDSLRKMNDETSNTARDASSIVDRVLGGDVTGARARGELMDPESIADAERQLVQFQEQIASLVAQLESAQAANAGDSFIARITSQLTEARAQAKQLEGALTVPRLKFTEVGLPLIGDLRAVNGEVRRLQQALSDTTMPAEDAALFRAELERAKDASELLKRSIDDLGGVQQIVIAARVEQNELTERDILKIKTGVEELFGPIVLDIRARFENGKQTADDIQFLRSLLPERPELLRVVARFENGQQTAADVANITSLLGQMKGPLDDIPALATKAGDAFVQQFGAAGRAIQSALELLNRFTGATEKASVANIRVRGPGLGPDALPGQLENDPSLGINVLRPALREGTEATKGLRRPLDDIASGSERIAGYNQQVASGIPRIGDGIDTLPRDVVDGQRGDFDRVVSAIDRLPLGIGSAVGGAIGGSVTPERGTFSFGGAANSLVGQTFSLGRDIAIVVENAFESAQNAFDRQFADQTKVFGVPVSGRDPTSIAVDISAALGKMLITNEEAFQIESAIHAAVNTSNDHLASIEASTQSFDDRLRSLSANEARLARLGAALNPLSGTSGTSGTGTRSGSTTRVVNANITIQNPGAGVNEPELRRMVQVAAGDFARELETARAFR